MAKILMPENLFSRSRDPAHIERLKNVAKWRLPREGSQEWVDFRLRSAAAEQSPSYRKELRNMARIATATSVAVVNNGAGLPADNGVREFIDEYNRRTKNYGLHYLPASFNILEGFTDYSAKYAVFMPLQESNNICSISGFLDFISRNPKENLGAVDLSFPENMIHHFSFIEPAGEWVFGDEGHRFALTSASIVRHANEITMMCLVGLEVDLSAKNDMVVQASTIGISDPDKPMLEVNPQLQVEAVALAGDSRYWRTYAVLRFDMDHGTIQSRYLMSDAGNAWHIKSDDPVSILSAEKLRTDSSREKSKSLGNIEEFHGLFVFLTQFLQLPNYFSEQADHIVRDKCITSISDLAGSSKGRRSYENSIRHQVVYERQVNTIPVRSEDVSTVVLPSFELQVETEGYWERLPFGTYGAGPNGERVVGRTWVNQTLSRRTAVMSGGLMRASRDDSRAVIGGDEGFIYVLRNASHQINLFKIGLTRRDVNTRAAEISRGTGIPDKFLTVQSWWVPDVVYAEKRIHALLDEYRLRDSREFFQAEYSAIRAAIDLVTSEMSGRSVPN